MSSSTSKHYLWSFAGKFIPQGLYLLTTIILARQLTPHDFGQIGVLSIFIAVANILIDCGLGGSLVKEDVLTKDDLSTTTVFNIGLGLIIYLVLFIASPLVAWFYQEPNLCILLRCLSLVFVINSWGVVPLSLLLKELRFKEICLINSFSVIVSSIVAIIMASNSFGPISIVAYQISQAIINVIGYYASTHYKVSFIFKKHNFKKLFPFGFYTTLCQTIDTIYENVLALLIGKFVNLNTAGLVYQAKRIEDVSSQSLTAAISRTAFPILTKIKENKHSFFEESERLKRVVALLLFPILCFVASFPDFFVSVLFGEEWLEASPFLSLLMIASILIIMENLNRTYIKSLGEVKTLFRVAILKRLIGVSIIVCFAIFTRSAYWIICGYIISSLLAFLFNEYIYCKLVQRHFLASIWGSVKYLFPCAILVLINILISHIFSVYVSMTLIILLLVLYYILLYFKLFKEAR